jgi:recombination protein RecA
VPRAEIEGEMGDAHMGLQARLMSQALRKLTATINRSKTLVIFINQIRMKIGVMFGNPETTTGGNALKFYSSVRLDIRRIGAIKDGENVIGNRTRVKVVKNKLAPPFKEVEFDIMYGEGISKEGDLLDLAANANVIEKSGTWYSYKDERIGQGRDSARNFLKERPEMVAEIRKLVLEKNSIGVKPAGATTTAPASAATASAPAKGAAPAASASTKTGTGATAAGPATTADAAAAKAKALAAASKAAQATSKK